MTSLPVADKPASALRATTVRRGAFWSAGGTLIMRFSNILVMILVARIVAPEQFGVFALAVTVHSLVVSIAELGVASAVARADLDLEAIAPTVVTISIVGSFLIALPMAVFALPIAVALGSADAVDSIRILSIGVALIGPFAVPGALLQREFRQDLVFRATAISFIPSSVVLIGLNLLGWGAESFAWSRVVGQVIMGVCMILSCSQVFLPGFRPELLRPLLAFSLPLAFANLLSQLVLNVDYLFIGRMLTVHDLGVYLLAFNISTWSTAVIGSMLNGIVLPAFSNVRQSGGDVSAAVSRSVGLVALIASPVAAYTCVFATPLITALYGVRWAEAGPVLASLSCYGFLFVIGLLIANILVSTGRTGPLLWVQAVALIGLAPALYFGIGSFGLIGAGAAHAVVVAVVTLPAYLIMLKRTTGTRFRAVLVPVLVPLCAGIAAAIAAVLATGAITNDWAKLLCGGAVGGLVYMVAAWKTVSRELPERFRNPLKIFAK